MKDSATYNDWTQVFSKSLSTNAENLRDASSILGSGLSPGEGNGNSLQYSCLGNPMERRAWHAIVHRVTQSWTWLKQLSLHACIPTPINFSRLYYPNLLCGKWRRDGVKIRKDVISRWIQILCQMSSKSFHSFILLFNKWY